MLTQTKITSVRARDEPPNIGWSHSRKWQLILIGNKLQRPWTSYPLNKDTFM